MQSITHRFRCVDSASQLVIKALASLYTTI